MPQYKSQTAKIVMDSCTTIRLNSHQSFHINLDNPRSWLKKKESNNYKDVKWNYILRSHFIKESCVTQECENGKIRHRIEFESFDDGDELPSTSLFLGSLELQLVADDQIVRHGDYSIFYASEDKSIFDNVTVVNPIDGQYVLLEPLQKLHVKFEEMDEKSTLHSYIMPADNGVQKKGLVANLERSNQCKVINKNKKRDYSFTYQFSDESILSIKNNSPNDVYSGSLLLFAEKSSTKDSKSGCKVNVSMRLNKHARRELNKVDKPKLNADELINQNLNENNVWKSTYRNLENIYINPYNEQEIVIDEKDLSKDLILAIKAPDYLSDSGDDKNASWNLNVNHPLPVESTYLSKTRLIGGKRIQIFEISLMVNNLDDLASDTNKINLIDLSFYYLVNYSISISVVLNNRRKNAKSKKKSNRLKGGTNNSRHYRDDYRGYYGNYAENDYHDVSLKNKYCGEDIVDGENVINFDDKKQSFYQNDYLKRQYCGPGDCEDSNTFDDYGYDSRGYSSDYSFDEVPFDYQQPRQQKLQSPEIIVDTKSSSLRDQVDAVRKEKDTSNQPVVLPNIYNIKSGDDYLIQDDQIFVCHFRSPKDLHGEKYKNVLWSINLLNKKDICLFLVESNIVVKNNVTWQEFKIGVLYNHTKHNNVMVHLSADDKSISFNIKVEKEVKTNFDHLTKITSELQENKIVELDREVGDIQQFRLPLKKNSIHNINVNTVNKRLEFICPMQSAKDKWNISSLKKFENIEHAERFYYDNWDGRGSVHFILTLRSMDNGLCVDTLTFMYNDESYINIGIWSKNDYSYRKQIEYKHPISSLYERNSTVYVKDWDHNDSITIDLQNKLSIDLPDIKKYTKETVGWAISIVENQLPDDVFNSLEEHLDSGLNRNSLFLDGQSGIIDFCVESPNIVRYLLKSTISYQKDAFDILSGYTKITNHSFVEAYRIIFATKVDDCLIQKVLNVNLIDNSDFPQMSFEEFLDLVDGSNIKVDVGECISLCFKRETNSELILKQYPIYLCLLEIMECEGYYKIDFYVGNQEGSGAVIVELNGTLQTVHVDIEERD